VEILAVIYGYCMIQISATVTAAKSTTEEYSLEECRGCCSEDVPRVPRMPRIHGNDVEREV